MLGRTANGLFWMFRYLERAENTARLLEAGFRLALTRGQGAATGEWRSVLVTLGQDQSFVARYAEFSEAQVINWVLRDADNPGSVINMLDHARSNARSVRTALTREVWEATNEAWMALRQMLGRPVRANNLGEILATIRRHATLVRGAMEGTMLRNENFNFARIGTFIERSDSTARILDVKYYVLLPSVGWVGSSLDNVQWETVLRSVSGERAYRWLNAGQIDPRGIANFLVLDGRFPRSLRSCYQKVESNMEGLARQYGCRSAAHEVVARTAGKLESATIETILEHGLHEFILDFLAENRAVADAIAREYRFVA